LGKWGRTIAAKNSPALGKKNERHAEGGKGQKKTSRVWGKGRQYLKEDPRARGGRGNQKKKKEDRRLIFGGKVPPKIQAQNRTPGKTREIVFGGNASPKAVSRTKEK